MTALIIIQIQIQNNIILYYMEVDKNKENKIKENKIKENKNKSNNNNKKNKSKNKKQPIYQIKYEKTIIDFD